MLCMQPALVPICNNQIMHTAILFILNVCKKFILVCHLFSSYVIAVKYIIMLYACIHV